MVVVFPVSDLFRRKLQTSLIIGTLSMGVASTISLILFCDRLGLGFSSSEDILTKGLIKILSQFALFTEILTFAVGAAIISFTAFLMISQRTKDIGLLKASGCPNDLVAGYFMTELFGVTIVACALGSVGGVTLDYALANFSGLQTSQAMPNYWLAVVVFIAFLAFALIFGTRPIISAAKLSPIKAILPATYFEPHGTKKFEPFSGSRLTWMVAYRSLARRQSASLRIVALVSLVFVLTTVSVAGGIIASNTSESWVKGPVSNTVTIAIAETKMAEQYVILESKFSAHIRQMEKFNYTDNELAVSPAVIQLLHNVSGIEVVESRLILEEDIREIGNFTIDPETLETLPVGDSRKGECLVIGVDPRNAVFRTVQGRNLDPENLSEAVVGDSIVHAMFSPNPSKGIILSNPLVEAVGIRKGSFQIVGVCVDSINNGNVVYVPLQKLSVLTDSYYFNIVFATLSHQDDLASKVSEIEKQVAAIDQSLSVIVISNLIESNVNFLAEVWQVLMIVPLLTLGSAALCLIGYMTLMINDQKQEFAIFRAIGGKKGFIVKNLALQSSAILFSGFGIGISLGTVITILVLMVNPVISSWTIFEVAAWLLLALTGILAIVLFTTLYTARGSILKSLA